MVCATAFSVMAASNELTIGEGKDKNSFIPSYSLYNYGKTQYIIPAEELTDMNCSKISGLRWYLNSGDKLRKVNVYLTEVEYTTLEGVVAIPLADIVYSAQGEWVINENDEIAIEFDKPYVYNGGNLMVTVFDNTGTWASGNSFWGISKYNASYAIFGDSAPYDVTATGGSARNFIPKTTFTYAEYKHDFSVELAEEQYLKEKADCQHGDIYYKSCSRCGKADTADTFEVGNPVGHKEFLKYVPATAATKENPGNKSYYVCKCGKYFADAEGKVEITDKNSVIIPKIVEPVVTPEEESMPTVKESEEEIKETNTDKEDVEGSCFNKLMLKATAKGNKITLEWKQIKDADGYIIYGSQCGQRMKQLAVIKDPKTVKKVFKKLKKGKYYKYMVVAYKKVAICNRVITKSKTVYCATKYCKKGNPTGIKLRKKKMAVKHGKKATIKATLKYKTKVMSYGCKLRYESSNNKVASVSKNGKIKACKKGTVTIYIYAQNGLCATIKITVK
jgi:hypothetical protein